MRRTSRRGEVLPGALLVVALLGLLLIGGAACTSSAQAEGGVPPTPAFDPTPASAPMATSTPLAATPTVVAASAPEEATSGPKDLIAIGEVIYQETAGGLGCQFCHGRDARGNIGPSIRGKTAGDIMGQLEEEGQMSFLSMSDKEVEAVAAYLQYLATQP